MEIGTTFCSYVSDVGYVVLQKCGGFQPPTVVVDRLVEIRTVSETRCHAICMPCLKLCVDIDDREGASN